MSLEATRSPAGCRSDSRLVTTRNRTNSMRLTNKRHKQGWLVLSGQGVLDDAHPSGLEDRKGRMVLLVEVLGVDRRRIRWPALFEKVSGVNVIERFDHRPAKPLLNPPNSVDRLSQQGMAQRRPYRAPQNWPANLSSAGRDRQPGSALHSTRMLKRCSLSCRVAASR
jgi:hypothetical protein